MDGTNSLLEIAQFLVAEMDAERLPALELTDDEDNIITEPATIQQMLIDRMTEIVDSFLENGVLMG